MALIIVLLVMIYARHSFKTNEKLEIVYFSVVDFDPVILEERSPVLLRESLQEPVATVKKLLKWWYCSARELQFRSQNTWQSKFTLLVAPMDCAIEVGHPSNHARVMIAMKRDQALLLPRSWSTWIDGSTDGWMAVGFDDVFTMYFSRMEKK